MAVHFRDLQPPGLLAVGALTALLAGTVRLLVLAEEIDNPGRAAII